MIATLVADPDHGRNAADSPNARPFRLRRPPLLEPPFDDEHTLDAQARCAQLPIDWDTAAVINAAKPMPPEHPGPGSVPAVMESTHAAARYVRLCLEVLNGFRPASHLRSLTGPVEFTDVVGQLSRRRNGHGHFPPRHGVATSTNSPRPPDIRRTPRGGVSGFNAAPDRFVMSPATTPPATTQPVIVAGRVSQAALPAHRGRSTAAATPFRLVRLRVSEPLEGIAEVVAVLSHAGSSLAMAFRLERRGSDWICTVVQVI